MDQDILLALKNIQDSLDHSSEVVQEILGILKDEPKGIFIPYPEGDASFEQEIWVRPLKAGWYAVMVYDIEIAAFESQQQALITMASVRRAIRKSIAKLLDRPGHIV